MGAIFKQEDVIRVAKSLITDFGESAKAEAENRIANSENVGGSDTASIWREVKIAINKINSDIDYMTERCGEPE